MDLKQEEEPKKGDLIDSSNSSVIVVDADNLNTTKTTNYVHPRRGQLSITENQYERYKALQRSPQDLIKWYSLRRCHIVSWISEYLTGLQPYTLKFIGKEGLETFLLAAEKVVALRKQNKPMKDIVNVSGDYILKHGLTLSAHEEAYRRFFIGQILWSFYETYPKHLPTITIGKKPMQHTIARMLALPKSEMTPLITAICVIISNVNFHSLDNALDLWTDGKLICLSRRVLGVLKEDERSEEVNEHENIHTINLRLALAKHLTECEQGHLLARTLKLSKQIYGDCHAITWECTDRLGTYCLTKATKHVLRYYFSKVQGDKVKAVMGMYEDFLDCAEEHQRDEKSNVTSREALSTLLRESVVPTIANFYMDHGKDREGRALLWKFTKDISSQLYTENWTPFIGLGKYTPLITTIRLAEGFDPYSDLKYSTLEAAIFPFDKISLQPVKPSDEEKTIKWHFTLDKLLKGEVHDPKNIEWIPGLQGGYEARTIPSNAAQKDDSVALEVPYITYSHFKSSQAYRLGKMYDYYRKGSTDQPQLAEWETGGHNTHTIFFWSQEYSEHIRSSDALSNIGSVLVDSEKGEIEKFVYDRETGTLEMTDQDQPPKEIDNLPTPRIIDISECSTTTAGFFNKTPGDTAAIDESGNVAGGFNLVSAEWHDWKRFILHPCASSETQPELTSTNGSRIPVLGYIYGSWTDQSLCRKWTGLQIWVVHARFSTSTDSNEEPSCHFLLNPNDLCSAREQEISATEARSICTFLNPSLLRVMNHSHLTPPICTMGEGLPDDFKGVTTKARPFKQWDLLSELTFRDSWDTEFAHIYGNVRLLGSRLEITKKQIKEETARRREWDREYFQIAKQWVSARR